MKASTDGGSEEFYNSLAPDYDIMTGFGDRLLREETVLREVVHRYAIGSALDAGCGTGLHSLVLSKLGVDVTGIDASPEMISLASDHARELNLSAKFLCLQFEEAGTLKPIDAVFCLGNSLPHVLSSEQLLASLHAFKSVLRPEGVLLVQLLNYERIMITKERIQSVKEEGDAIFVRFYDFEEKFLRFNVLTLKRVGQSLASELHSTRLHPITWRDLSDMLTHIGFHTVDHFSNLKFEAFSSETSRDVVLAATC